MSNSCYVGLSKLINYDNSFKNNWRNFYQFYIFNKLTSLHLLYKFFIFKIPYVSMIVYELKRF